MASSLPPNGLSSVRAHSQANNIVQKDAAKANVPVHSFDPDASPMEKAAAAGKARTQLNSTTAASPEVSNGGARGLYISYGRFLLHTDLLIPEAAVDTGNDVVLPTITIEDVDKGQPDDIPQPLPGLHPASEPAAIPDWYKVGWRAFTDIDKPLEDEDKQQLRLMNSWISQQYYGEWYHNAAVIISVCLSCVLSLGGLTITHTSLHV